MATKSAEENRRSSGMSLKERPITRHLKKKLVILKVIDIENTLNHWFGSIPKHLFKSIIFDCGKEFSNWKAVSNQHDIAIYFPNPGTLLQRALNKTPMACCEKIWILIKSTKPLSTVLAFR